jgi:transcriptional regulator with XRE-family HTH domain
MNNYDVVSILVGQKLKKLRCEAGYTGDELSKLAGCISAQQLYRYENGSNKIDVGVLVVILRILDTNIGVFFEEVIKHAYKETLV